MGVQFTRINFDVDPTRICVDFELDFALMFPSFVCALCAFDLGSSKKIRVALIEEWVRTCPLPNDSASSWSSLFNCSQCPFYVYDELIYTFSMAA